ncbi:telomere-associated protein RIF1 isoform X1 [Bufo gargarizans]|uniref:telomere-associated protein RIF1 isoform X1 n=1 Tax=Bufo gargarizans TaxID=30331 RepID=UPI001CF246DA|nr:telomere-associated protein RIF1 isoform X1 [Bufo gargarizans]XP_044158865.1 telomere-associated protein RIF1 isoform X1 [Bufo gargarizans]XP_044158866.1 telomere-associated protein RIF1 isoform X1 [Bufo gargarizans]
MAAVLDDSQLVPLLETLEDSSTSHTEKTDAYLSTANRLSGEDGKEFTALVAKNFSRLFNVFKTHIGHQHSDLSNAALQTLGFCVFNSTIASGISASEVQELLSTLNSIAVKSADKNSCTRALWVISKQNFSPEEVGKVVPSILSTLENVLKDVQSLVIAYEALNVIIRLLEQAPAQMTTEAVRWAKLILPLVIHSAPKVRIRAATGLEIGVPLLLQKHPEVAALTEQLMTSKIISELHKLFTSKNETYVLKLWPLFVKLLGKTLHRSGSFINSLLQLEELGFRSATPAVKKIAFIAWKSLIDNFALNPDILCSSKRIKLLMQPLSSINVRTELLALTKVEVWWYLLLRLGSQLPTHFEQVCLPLIQSALSVDCPSTPLRSGNQSLASSTPLQKGSFPFGSPATPKINLNSSLLATVAFPSVHLLGIEMMLHFLLGPDVVQFAARHKLVLSLEPLQHRLINSPSFFSKHASTLLGAVQDGFITIGKDASGAVLHAVWKDMIEFVKASMETGSKKERQGSEVLTFLLQALKNIIVSNALQVEKCLCLLECTVKGLPQKVLASAAYQVANMDLLNGTPALFLIQLHFHPGLLEHGVSEERFFMNYETLVSYVFSGPTSPLAFSESVLQELNQGAKLLENKELLWRMWSILINPLTERINQTNEVNQGDALEHNFSALHNALMLPINHIFPVAEIPQPTMKTLMRTWSELYKVFSRCAALVTTTDENVCCEELCSRILAGLGDQILALPLLERLVQVITVIVECVNFSPYSTKYQPIIKGPQTPTDWAKKKRGPLGNLHSALQLLEKLIEGFHTSCSDQSLLEVSAPTLTTVGSSIISCLSTCLSHISVPSVLRTVFSSLTKPISVFYAKTKSESPKVYSSLSNKLDKLLGDVLSCLGSRYTGSYDNELLEVLSPLLCAIFLHKSKAFRNQVTQFWNGSFAKAAVLVYPEEMKPVLSQVKFKTPILLPGFTCSNSTEEYSGAYSDNLYSSELGTKISGIEVKSAGKRDFLLAKAEEPKEKGTPTKAPQAKLKLDFSSPNTKKKLLEEEQSVDFVFIPPETKERVLTEHQKEVLRTKRVDIPTMYNNLDASQDTTLFTQYTQSQENELEKPVLDDPKEVLPVAKAEKSEEIEKSEAATKEEKISNEVINVKMLEEDPNDNLPANDSSVLNASNDCQNTSNTSNGSASSDMVSGTPPPPVSRRQSFITLEKFDNLEIRSFSPLADKKFVKSKEVILVPDSQEAVNIKETSENLEKNEKTAQTPETEHNQIDVSKSDSKRETRASRAAEQSRSQVSEDDGKESLNVSAKMDESNIVPDSQPSQVDEKSAELEKGKTVAVSKADTKENTPPDTDETVNHQKTLSNQITLRRSSRRQSEILDAVKNENEPEKLIQAKGEPKMVSKKTMPSRETAKRQQSEAIVKSEGEEDLNTSRKHQDEDSRLANSCDKEDLPDTNSSKDSQEKSKVRSRYQTRRSLQAVVPAVNNSESENSEALEGSVRKKRRGRPRNLDKSDRYESSQESQTEVTLKHPEDSFSIRDLNKSESERDDKTYTLDSDYSASYSKIVKSEPDERAPLDSKLGAVESDKTYDISKNATEVYSTTDSLMTEPTAGDFSTAASDVFQSSKSVLRSLDCHHKRSKRFRRSKSSDCCCESASKDAETEEPESKNQKIHMSSTMELNDTVFSGPCAISTPLANDQVFFKTASEIRSDTESEQEQTTAPLSDSHNDTEVTQVFVGTETIEAPETSSEISVDETVVAGSPKDAKSETVVVECVENDREEDKEMEVELNTETTSGKTYDIEVSDVPTSSIVDEKPEEEVLENAQTVMVDEGDGQERNDTEPETVLSVEDIEIQEVQACEVAESVDTAEEAEDKRTIAADETIVNGAESNDLHQMNAETISEIKNDTGTVQIDAAVDVIPDGEKVDENAKVTEKAYEDLGEGRSNIDSPPKVKGFPSMIMADSPSGSFCWSPSASPSTSILKKGLKRQQEIESPSPVNKIRRVSFADPIYQEGLADDIDRRSPVIRNSSSPSSRSLKMLTNNQPKINTTPTKGFVSPGARVLGFKSSKKSLISEMTKESMPSPKESVYPALMNCTTPVDVILPQITSNMWARGLGQLIRAKNIKTIGDLSTLTPCEIKTLPIRSPKISTVKKALRIYHEQQTKFKGYDEFAVLDESEKPLNGVDEKPGPADEEKIERDLPEASATTSTTETSSTPDILAQIDALSVMFTSEELGKYSGSQLFEMQEKLGMISNCVFRHLQSRWRSPPHGGSV